MKHPKTCIIIAGPTATGKTALAISLAKYFSTEIISADSRQCYKELNIGVAKPSVQELSQVPHHFVHTHSIHDHFSAADYEQYALAMAHSIFETKDVVIVAGGTGLYLKAFAEGMDAIPKTDPLVKEQVVKDYQQHGMAWLQETIKEKDPAFFASGEIQNPHRVMRALEVLLSSGRPITTYQSNEKKQRAFNIIKIALEMPREMLYARINKRVDVMMAAGLFAEAQNLHAHKALNALQTVGYRELFDHIDGFTTLERAVELIKQNTRHYAKRQVIWFKKDKEIFWANPHDQQGILNHIKAVMSP